MKRQPGVDTQAEWHKLTFGQSFLLVANKTYFYEIKTGSYPQIHHRDELAAEGGMGIINCTSFVDANGRSYTNWIPAIRLIGDFVNEEGVHNIDSGKDFSTIQAAIDDNETQDNHTIEVYAGTYVENVVIRKRLTLHGIGMPTFDANGTESAITVSADGCVVDGFNVTGGLVEFSSGISVTSDGNTLSNNTASNNFCGIRLFKSSNNTIMYPLQIKG
ncbi:Cell surface glycoprotein [ANME-1 cluster archaeon GoMg2]|nr:Cell surface glycoprotein [ANME-1 cluster archaeon GoMg2]